MFVARALPGEERIPQLKLVTIQNEPNLLFQGSVKPDQEEVFDAPNLEIEFVLMVGGKGDARDLPSFTNITFPTS